MDDVLHRREGRGGSSQRGHGEQLIGLYQQLEFILANLQSKKRDRHGNVDDGTNRC